MILLVDDEPLIARNGPGSLGSRRLPCHVGWWRRAEAIAFYQHNPESVDAVLLDMMMPGMDGFATKDGLRAINPHVPIIASSGLRRPGAEGGRLADVDGFLPKPYSDDQLLRIVRQRVGFESQETSERRLSDQPVSDRRRTSHPGNDPCSRFRTTRSRLARMLKVVSTLFSTRLPMLCCVTFACPTCRAWNCSKSFTGSMRRCPSS